ncbi:MAG: HTH domain-containing protein, partial [Planctomycetes bacterium]|nr:HTH domain-containing protein [Planctomycetota bacterium]
MRTKRIERLLKLLQALQEGVPVTVEELARLIDVSRRTVFRDLSLLGEAGIRFNYDRETRRYTAERPALLPPVSLTHAEALSLMMASRYMLDRPFVTDRALGARAALKLESMLPTVLLEFCGRMLTRQRGLGSRIRCSLFDIAASDNRLEYGNMDVRQIGRLVGDLDR